MIREAPAMTVRQNLGELLNEVQYRHDKVVITKGGKPVAALIDMVLFDKIRALDQEFDRLTMEMAQAFEGLPPADGEALVDEAVRSVRDRAGRK
jgi:prevent-host-death family protein